MATRRTTATPRPRRLLAALALLTAASTAISIGALPGLGVAEPRPTIEQVQHRIDVLNDQADRAVEAYAQARIALADARRTSAVSQGRVRREEAGLAAVRRAMSSVAASAYRSGGTDALVSLVSTSSPQAFLDRAASLDRIARDQAAQLAAMATARHQLLVVQDQANRDLARQKDAEAAVVGQKATIQRTLRAQKSLLASLQAEERARLARLQAERAATARRLATLARASRLRELVAASTDGSSSGALYNGPASGRAGAAVSEAYNKLGSPYEWGAAGPSRFDCSGLTMWAWARGGVSLPHSSQAQYDSIQHVAQSDVQPGDLVFFGSPIHHVGIYIGGGRMISAPHTGDVVKIQDAFRSDFVGAGRP